jgi:hypothetical protein
VHTLSGRIDKMTQVAAARRSAPVELVRVKQGNRESDRDRRLKHKEHGVCPIDDDHARMTTSIMARQN